ncbi:MAG TPA: M1 family metallopeptidase [Longimicrobiales bacterium]
MLVVLAACSRAPEPGRPAPVDRPAEVVAPPAAAPSFVRYAVEPVPVPPAYAAAIERGTRTRDGRPGPRYWQQRVDYRIDAELDPATARVQGAETITYHNRSPDTLAVMVFHLYQNLYSEGVQRTRTVPITGGMTLGRVAVDGVEAREAVSLGGVRPGMSAYQVAGTLMSLRLPRPLAPGDSAVIDIEWDFIVPPEGAPRTGQIDHVVYNVAQWYPQVAVYDDVMGWHAWPYLGNGEFYLEYGDFDVALTLPEGWLVAATGVLQNPDEVLTDRVRERLRAALSTDDVVRVVAEEDLGPGTATQQTPGGQLTWRFTAEDVRDFAWAASDRYLWDATRARLPDADGDGAAEVVPVYAFYRPEAETWREAARYTRHALEFHAEHWHPYIYPRMTAVEGPIGGMEYPMLVFVRDFGDARTLYSVLNHETAHEWWPMMVGSKESSFAWQDEGLGTYIENLATNDFFPDADAFEGSRRQYLAVAGSGVEVEIMRPADLFGPYPLFATASYSKPATLLRALGGVIGEDTLHRALREYADRWLLKHPYALDFFNTVESVAGRDLDWFWHPWWYETATLDQAIVDVGLEAAAGGGERVAITVEDQGEAPMPVELVVTTETGETRRVLVPVDVWLAGARRHTETVTVPARVTRVAIDPDETFPDADRSDNTWVRGATGGA